MKNIGEKIKEARMNKGLTTKELAMKVGKTERTVRYWETGERQLSLQMADKVLKVLDMSLTIGKEN
ncbi:MAG: multiprotein-bridging factor 1 family protein [Lachnospiraceae bacterium]